MCNAARKPEHVEDGPGTECLRLMSLLKDFRCISRVFPRGNRARLIDKRNIAPYGEDCFNKNVTIVSSADVPPLPHIAPLKYNKLLDSSLDGMYVPCEFFQLLEYLLILNYCAISL